MKTPIVIGGQKIGRLRASFLLFREAWRFLRADKELLLVPIFSMIFSGILIGLLTLLFVVFVAPLNHVLATENSIGLVEYAYLFTVYLSGGFSLAVAEATIVHIVYVRAHGGNATLTSGLARAFSNWYPLFIWALITSTVGMVLRFISERSQIVGKIVGGLLGAAWAILTIFAVPVIILDKKNPVKAIGTSAMLFKKTWGETLVSNITLGLVFMVAHLIVLGSFIGLIIYSGSTLNAPLLIASIIAVVIWLILATLVNAALQGILKTLLYIYAAENVVPANFNRELLESILVRKGVVETTTNSTPNVVSANTLV